jgi:hypothetical protein
MTRNVFFFERVEMFAAVTTYAHGAAARHHVLRPRPDLFTLTSRGSYPNVKKNRTEAVLGEAQEPFLWLGS